MNQPAHTRGPIARFFVGLWDAMNFTRRLILNLLFFGLLLLFLAALGAGKQVKPLLERTTLVIEPQGRLVEQYTQDPATRALSKAMGEDMGEVQLRDLLRALEAARTDKRIERVLLKLDGLQADGVASLRELADAIAELKASGKQVIAFAEMMDQRQYLLAAQANEVYLDPMGGLLLEGLARYRQYYREGLQDKLGVDVHLFKVGEYKSAAEPYILDGSSPEAREADLFWMGDLWNRYLDDVAAARKLERGALDAMIAALPERVAAAGGDMARLALDEKLVDGLKTWHEFEQLMIERGVEDKEEHTFVQVAMPAYLTHHRLETLRLGEQPTVAVVVAEGGITDGEQPQGTVGGESTSELLRQAREDETVKAVVLRVNSPGGGVYPSEQIRREVELLREAGKPVFASMGDVAASGGYWISMNADRIYADESTITGSIGIYGLFLTGPRALEKIGVRADGVGTTPLAGAFDPTRALSPEVGSIIQSVINKGYADFIGKVSAARERPQEEIDAVARGRVWSGAQARERGLVDELGGLRAAIAAAAAKVELEDGKYAVRYIERARTPFEQALADWSGNAAVGPVARAFAPALLGVDPRTRAQLADELAWLQGHARTPYRPLAHCLCGF